MKQTRVNILTAVNASSVQVERTEIDGEQYTAIRNVKWHVDDIVLNDGLYPAEENAKAYQSMEGRLMPFGHPQVNGQYIAISDQSSHEAALALGKHYGGVHATNVRKEGSEYYADVMINERLAVAHPDGTALLGWAESVQNGEKPDPIHMSTGLMLNRVKQSGKSRGKSYSWIAKNQQYDHLAILLHERGAGGDDISLAVNCDEVINSDLSEAQQADAAESIYQRVLNYFTKQNNQQHSEESDEMTKEELQAELQARDAQLNELGAGSKALADQLASVTAKLEELTSAIAANSDKELAEKRSVVAKELGEVVANALSGEALDAAFAKFHKAAPLGVNSESDPVARPTVAEHFGSIK